MWLLQVDPYYNDNKQSKALFASQMAKKLNMAGLILGLLYWALIIVVGTGLGVGLGVGLNASYYG